MPHPVPPFKPLGDAMRAVRAHLGLSQARIADRAGTTASWLSPFESGRMLPSAVAWQRWLGAIEAVDVGRRSEEWLTAFGGKLDAAKALYVEASTTAASRSTESAPGSGAADTEADMLVRSILLMWESVPGRGRPAGSDGDLERRTFVLSTVKAATALPLALAFPPAGLAGAASIVDGVIGHTAQLRQWYRHLPSAALIPMVEANRALLTHLIGQAKDKANGALLSALGETELLLGWVDAFDTGDHSAAVPHFTQALAAAKGAGDRSLAALVLTTMADLTRHLNQLPAAIELGTRAAWFHRTSDASPAVGAFVHVVNSMTHAKAADRQAGERALDQARAEVARFTDADLRSWRGVGLWDEVRFAGYEGAALIKVDRLEDAERTLCRGLDELAPDDGKYRGLYLADLANARIRAGQIEAGCEAGMQAVQLARVSGDAFSLNVVWGIVDDLAEHRAHPAVIDLKDQLFTVTREQA